MSVDYHFLPEPPSFSDFAHRSDLYRRRHQAAVQKFLPPSYRLRRCWRCGDFIGEDVRLGGFCSPACAKATKAEERAS